MHVLRRRLRSLADAEDLTQLTLLRAYQRIDRYDPRRRFSAWLFTIALRLSVDHHRRQRAVCGEAALGGVADARPDPAEAASDRERRNDLWDIAERVLTPDQWTALWLHYGEDQTAAEIANVLGRSAMHVRVLLYRARKALAPHLTHHTEPESAKDDRAEPAIGIPLAVGVKP